MPPILEDNGQIMMRKPGRLASKPLSIDPYLEILREKVTGERNASVRKYLKAKIKMLTSTQHVQETRKNRAAGRTGKPDPA